MGEELAGRSNTRTLSIAIGRGAGHEDLTYGFCSNRCHRGPVRCGCTRKHETQWNTEFELETYRQVPTAILDHAHECTLTARGKTSGQRPHPNLAAKPRRATSQTPNENFIQQTCASAPHAKKTRGPLRRTPQAAAHGPVRNGCMWTQ